MFSVLSAVFCSLLLFCAVQQGQWYPEIYERSGIAGGVCRLQGETARSSQRLHQHPRGEDSSLCPRD